MLHSSFMLHSRTMCLCILWFSLVFVVATQQIVATSFWSFDETSVVARNVIYPALIQRFRRMPISLLVRVGRWPVLDPLVVVSCAYHS